MEDKTMKAYPRAWSNAQILQLSALLKDVNVTKPSDLHRSIRSLNHIKHWKGTEFRTILLYVGVVLFKDYLNQDEYNLFLKLVCAVTICSTKAYTHLLPVARKLFIEFIEMHINLYEEHSITSNIHLLSHAVDDVWGISTLSALINLKIHSNTSKNV